MISARSGQSSKSSNYYVLLDWTGLDRSPETPSSPFWTFWTFWTNREQAAKGAFPSLLRLACARARGACVSKTRQELRMVVNYLNTLKQL
jgi:hypothetical protein